MHTHTLVQCTSRKRQGLYPACDLYDASPLFRSQREYARAVGDSWGVLSAEHHYLQPTDLVESYDTRIEDVDSEAWAETVADQLRPLFTEHPDAEIVFTAGAKYADPLIPELEHRFGAEVREPFRGQRLQKRRESMERRAAEALNEQLGVA